MVAGDAILVKLKAVGAGRTNYQPAAGVEVCITDGAFVTAAAPAASLELYDGTDGAAHDTWTTVNKDAMATGGAIGRSTAAGGRAQVRIFITNTIYLSLNASQANDLAMLSGVQTK